MKLQVILLGLIIFVCSFCAHAKDDEERSAVFSQEYMAKHYEATLRPWLYTYWSPTFEQTQQIDVYKYLERNDLLTKVRSLEDYAFQYYGILDKGMRSIEMQAVCLDTTTKDWKHALYLVKGGGNCFFQLSYDVGSREISGFHVNSSR